MENVENARLPFWKRILESMQGQGQHLRQNLRQNLRQRLRQRQRPRLRLRPTSVLIFLLNFCFTLVMLVYLAVIYDEYQQRTIGCVAVDATRKGWLKAILLELFDHLRDYSGRKKRLLFCPKAVPHYEPCGVLPYPLT